MRSWASWIIGFAVFFALARGLGTLFGATTCRDGWPSPSIGRRGACSHHGGVDRSEDWLLIFPVIGGTVAGIAFHKSRVGRLIGGERWSETAKKPRSPEQLPPLIQPFVPPQPGEEECPKCGSAMRLRVARRGSRRGKQFWGCLRFPSCNGTLPIKQRRRPSQPFSRPQPPSQ